jgi:predicted ArsR family transcriptional regulator
MSPRPTTSSPSPSTARRSTRHDVLTALKAAPEPTGIAQLAEALGIHVNTVRFHLGRLVQSGQVEQVEPARSGPGRPASLFRAVEGMDTDGPRRFRMLAEILTRSLAAGPAPGRRAVEAGRDWGRHLPGPARRKHPVNHLVAVLEDVGFAPEQGRSDRTRIGLRHCPFLELAETHRSVVCPIHLGLMRGVLESVDASVTVDRLEPFVRPDLCVAHLSATSPASPASPTSPASTA